MANDNATIDFCSPAKDFPGCKFTEIRSCCGVIIRFESNSEELLCDLARLLPTSACASACKADVRFSLAASRTSTGEVWYQFKINGRAFTEGSDLTMIRACAEQSMRETVAVLTPDFVFVHAGVAGWEGQAILVPGASGSGKTTLIMALVAAGATYYSDEYAVLDRKARVHAYLRPPQLRGEQGHDVAQQVASFLTGEPAPPASLPVGAVLSTVFERKGEWHPRRLTIAESFEVLLRNSLAVRCHPERTLDVLKHVCLSANCFRSGRREASDMAAAALQLLNNESRPRFKGVQ